MLGQSLPLGLLGFERFKNASELSQAPGHPGPRGLFRNLQSPGDFRIRQFLNNSQLQRFLLLLGEVCELSTHDLNERVYAGEALNRRAAIGGELLVFNAKALHGTLLGMAAAHVPTKKAAGNRLDPRRVLLEC